MEDYVLGIDIGGTKIAVCGSNFSDVTQGIMRFPSNISSDYDTLVNNILTAIETYIAGKEQGRPPRMLGFGLKDAVDKKAGIWQKSPSTKDFKPLHLNDLTMQRYGIPSVMDNDVHAATVAEIAYGAGQHYDNFIYFNVGTGISIGVVIDGKLLSGATNYAGEAGHMSVEPDGELCPWCGQRGCLENIASGEAIITQAMAVVAEYPDSQLAERYRQSGFLTSRDVFQLAQAGDVHAVRISQRVVKALTVAMRSLIHIFNPEAIILGGGVMSDAWLISILREEVPKCLLSPSQEALKDISLSDLGADHVGILGALALARMECKEKGISI